MADPVTLDATDLRILDILQRDASQSNQELAAAALTSPATWLLAEKILDEPFARIPGDAFYRIHETQRGGGDHRLLDSEPEMCHAGTELRRPQTGLRKSTDVPIAASRRASAANKPNKSMLKRWRATACATI